MVKGGAEEERALTGSAPEDVPAGGRHAADSAD